MIYLIIYLIGVCIAMGFIDNEADVSLSFIWPIILPAFFCFIIGKKLREMCE